MAIEVINYMDRMITLINNENSIWKCLKCYKVYETSNNIECDRCDFKVYEVQK